MLSELHVKDLALVEDVWLEFGPGLTVLTGETGAGKTVLVSALKLLLGERADSTLVREGADEALVEGRFVIDGRDVLVRRRLTSEGRSKCTVDGEMATVTTLSELLGPHVDLHGQHEHQALLSAARHADYLDRFSGDAALDVRVRYQAAWRAMADARDALGAAQAALADRDRKADYLRFQVRDIDAVAPRSGESEELQARLPRLRHGERLAGSASAAWSALRDEGGVTDALSVALTALSQSDGLDPTLDALAEAMSRLDVELAEVASALREYTESIEHDPAALDETERRLQQLSDLQRKYGPTIDDVLRTRAEAEAALAVLDEGEGALERLQALVESAEIDLRTAAVELEALRDGAVAPFTARLAAAVAALALPNASFQVARHPLVREAWTSDGPERVEFLFASGPGESPRPLQKVASGGEVSRVMLALKSVLGAADAVPVLVFDEVDAGIGGATALAVGQRLAALAGDHQVLVITHLPQVAAYASAHIVVEKAHSAGRTVTTARPVEGDDLVTEIARMLAGDASSTGMAHARELLISAASAVARGQ